VPLWEKAWKIRGNARGIPVLGSVSEINDSFRLWPLYPRKEGVVLLPRKLGELIWDRQRTENSVAVLTTVPPPLPPSTNQFTGRNKSNVFFALFLIYNFLWQFSFTCSRLSCLRPLNPLESEDPVCIIFLSVQSCYRVPPSRDIESDDNAGFAVYKAGCLIYVF
jgi:hypothetical protein